MGGIVDGSSPCNHPINLQPWHPLNLRFRVTVLRRRSLLLVHALSLAGHWRVPGCAAHFGGFLPFIPRFTGSLLRFAPPLSLFLQRSQRQVIIE